MATTVVPRTDQAERDHWRFSLEDYHRLIDFGVLKSNDRVELIDGEILMMSPMGKRHAGMVRRLTRMLTGWLAERATVSVQLPLMLLPASEPEPDIAVLTFRPDDYAGFHPGAGDVIFVIEVADSSVRFDRERKLPLYAAAGIAEAWIVDLVRNVVVVASGSTADGYTTVVEHKAGATVAPAAFPDITIDVAELLR